MKIMIKQLTNDKSDHINYTGIQEQYLSSTKTTASKLKAYMYTFKTKQL